MNDHVMDYTLPGEFLQSIYDLCRQSKDDEALGVMLAHIDDLLLTGEFEAVDAILWQADLSKLSTDAMVGFLSSTLAARSKLHDRAKFFILVRQWLLAHDRTNVDELLKGLE